MYLIQKRNCGNKYVMERQQFNEIRVNSAVTIKLISNIKLTK